jgi:hypothetical protein
MEANQPNLMSKAEQIALVAAQIQGKILFPKKVKEAK